MNSVPKVPQRWLSVAPRPPLRVGALWAQCVDRVCAQLQLTWKRLKAEEQEQLNRVTDPLELKRQVPMPCPEPCAAVRHRVGEWLPLQINWADFQVSPRRGRAAGGGADGPVLLPPRVSVAASPARRRRPVRPRVGVCLFVYCSFCRERGLNPAKTSTLASIVYVVVKRDRADGVTTMERSFEQFTSLMVAHSVNRVPRSEEVFSLTDVEAIVEYVTNRCPPSPLPLQLPRAHSL